MGLLSPKLTQEHGKHGKDGKVFIDTLMSVSYTHLDVYKRQTLDAQYEKEQSELTAEISVLEKAVKSYEKHEKDADRFIALIDKYENFDKLTIAMLNEFIEKILVHELSLIHIYDVSCDTYDYFLLGTL